MIEVENLTKRFGKVEALRGVSFDAADGRITGLLGPNGAGKSTTLRILCTILKADTGKGRVGGLDVAENPLAVRNRIGVLPHNSNLYPNLTARENIAYYAALQGVARDAIDAAVERVIDLLGVGTLRTGGPRAFPKDNASAPPWPAPWCTTRTP